METNVNTTTEKTMSLLKVSSSPHIRTTDSVQRIMLDVIIALIPAIVFSVVYFGIRALLVIGVSVLAAVAAEACVQKALKRRVTIYDFSAVVTGILLAFNVPSTMPLWQVAVGSVFAIVVVKQVFGGLGQNFINPALAGRAMLLASWGQNMSRFATPFQPDVISGPTPLSGGEFPTLMDMFLGKMPGVLGEVSTLALLLGAAYLLVRGVIRIRIPAVMIGSFVVFMSLFGMITGEVSLEQIPQQVLAGGLILGAFFMATDYATAPMTAQGQLIFACGAGLLTALIRSFGGYPEGVSYAILLMNVCTPLIDKYCVRKPFGGVKK